MNKDHPSISSDETSATAGAAVARHTPGPWKGRNKKGAFDAKGFQEWDAPSHLDNSSECAAIYGADGKVVAIAVYEGLCIGFNKKLAANVDLLSAAPDLLEALEGLERTVSHRARFRDKDRSIAEFLILARTALSKAKGE